MKPAACVPAASLPERDLYAYRGATIRLLRRYFQDSIEVGRLPALLGREVFRSRRSDRQVHSFEDSVIFVHDIERCLERLDELDRQIISHIIFEEYTEEETAFLVHRTDRTVRNRFPEALDALTAIFLERRLLEAFPAPVENPCQEGEEGDSAESACKHGK